ncbi:hypothetical protein H6P81_018909 [Aristolochia fimbriata]|uniref:Uncharacterized protein n=1 Tax=Aristolochia fimbriata TaxID=158543 RepID=A0AAV7E2A8_ARIFI|nr:hypothetical protein H6P81_018909 [Aristolochia fimbriata]
MKTHYLNFASRPEMLSVKYITYGHEDVTFAPYSAHWRHEEVVWAAFGARSKYHDMFLSTMKNAIRATGGFGLSDLFRTSRLLLWITGIKAKLSRTTAFILFSVKGTSSSPI